MSALVEPSSSAIALESPSKRSRDDSAGPEELDEAAQAKIARKEARVIRNRESAQRSRNQRKHYLANLEVRNRELEEEVRRLRGGESASDSTRTASPFTSSPKTTVRETSPEENVLTLAGELGIPPQMVSSGVNLSSVKPPVDGEVRVKQEPATSIAPANPEVGRLVAQNKALTQRVSMLENLLKQVVAVSNLGGLDQPVQQQPAIDTLPVPEPSSAVDDVFDFNSFLQPTASDSTVPNYVITTANASITSSDSNEITPSSFHPVACHSAAVATFVSSDTCMSDEGKAQQRARGTGNKLDSRLITTERLDKVARILGALAELRGWTSRSRSPFPPKTISSVWDLERKMGSRRLRALRDSRDVTRRYRRGMRE